MTYWRTLPARWSTRLPALTVCSFGRAQSSSAPSRPTHWRIRGSDSSYRRRRDSRFRAAGRSCSGTPFLIHLLDLGAREIVFEDLGRGLSVLGHLVGAHLAEAGAVAVAAADDRDRIAPVLDPVPQRAAQLGAH